MKLRYIITYTDMDDDAIQLMMADKERYLAKLRAMMNLPPEIEIDLEAVEDTPANDNTPIPEQPKGTSVPSIKIAA